MEGCEEVGEGQVSDWVRPDPGVGWENGMRFMPGEEPRCEEFVQGDWLNNG